MREILYHPNGEPRLFAPGIAMVAVAFFLTLLVVHVAGRPKSDQERADALMHSGKAAAAEHVYASLVRAHPDVPNVMALLKAHNMSSAIKKVGRADLQSLDDTGGLSETEIDGIVDALADDIKTIARFVRGMH